MLNLEKVLDTEDEFGLDLALGYCRRLKLTEDNAPVIANYLNALGNEIHLSINYKRMNLTTLVYISRFLSNKKFKEMTKEDITLYLNSLRKDELKDPSHRWVSTYNLYLVILTRFFKWLYYPDRYSPINYPYEYFSFIQLLSIGARECIKFAYDWISYHLISNTY